MASDNFHKAREEQAAARHRRLTKTKTYRVAGKNAVLGVKPGGTVELTVDHAERLLRSGNITNVRQEPPADETGQDRPDDKE